MLKFLWNFFFGDTSEANKRYAQSKEKMAAAGASIRFNATLIGKLKNDHKELIKLYGEIGTCFDSGMYQQLKVKLGEFKNKLNGHLLTENIRFYVYLEQLHISNEENYALIKEFRREMNGIARTVAGFLKEYQAAEFNDKEIEAFKIAFPQIGGALAQRIKREEADLYSLYVQISDL